MYLRFVFAKPHDGTRRRVGIVWDGRSRCDDSEEVDAIYEWLKRNLPVPPRDVFSADRALCWFKLEAHGCIQRARDLAFLLERRGERIWQIYSLNPGLITYEDEYQVVAVPESALRQRHQA